MATPVSSKMSEYSFKNQSVSLSQALGQSCLDKKVRILHWKSNVHLPEALRGETDLDLLLHEDDRKKFVRIMAELGFLKIQSQPWVKYRYVEDWIGLDGNTGKFIHLHVHTKILTGIKHVKHLVLPWEKQLFETHIKDEASGFPVVCPSHELVILLIRMWAKMPISKRLYCSKVPPHIFAEFLWLREQVGKENLKNTLRDFNLGVQDMYVEQIYAIFTNEDQAQRILCSISRMLYKQCKPYYKMPFLQAIAVALFHRFNFNVSRVYRKMSIPKRHYKTLCKRGMIIAIIGADGSGKSTLVKALNNWLRYKLDSHVLYMGSGDGRTGFVNKARIAIYKMLHRKFKNKLQTTDAPKPEKVSSFEKINTARHNSPTFKRLYYLFDLLLLWRKVRLLKHANKMVERGSIFICDRYPQEQFLGINDGYMQQNGRGFLWAAKIERSLMAKIQNLGPDLLIKLFVCPHIALARKPDHSLGNIKDKCKIIETLDIKQANTYTIQSDKSAEDVLAEAQNLIWKAVQDSNDHSK